MTTRVLPLNRPAFQLFCITALAAFAISAGGRLYAQEAAPVAGVSPAVARSIPTEPDRRHVFVLDSARLLDAKEIAALQDSAQRLQSETGADIVFVTLPTLHGGAVEEAALAIGRAWKIGSAGAPGDPARNRGVVLLYVSDKKSVAGGNLRVEIGRGLEGAITDGGGSRAIIEAIKPHFRAKRYGDGFVAAFNVAAPIIRAERPAQSAAATPAARTPRKGSPAAVLWAIVSIVVLVVFAVLFLVRRGRRGSTGGRSTSHARPRKQSILPRRRAAVAAGDESIRAQSSGSSSSDSTSLPSSSDDSSSGGSFGGGGGFSGGGASDSV